MTQTANFRDIREVASAALRYAEAGWPVFPLHTPRPDGSCDCHRIDCRSIGKHPRTRDGHNGATTDATQIRMWWRSWPSANIGIACGPAGWAVVDVDPRHGGDDSYAALIEELGASTFATATALTGGGGRHCIFRLPDTGVACATAVRPGIDIRAAGGYIVAAPSIHASGKRYEWERSPFDQALLPWPAIRPARAEPLPILASAGTPGDGAFAEGSRNDRLTKMAGALRRQGADSESILAALRAANERQCRPPLGEAEVAAIAASVSRYAPAALRLVPASGANEFDEEEAFATRPWPNYGPEPFIGLAGEFIERMLPHSEADPMALLVHFLAAFCTAVGTKPHFVVGTEKHHAHDYFGVVGATSRGRKGTSWSPVKVVFDQAFSDWKERHISGLSSGEGLVNAVRDPVYGLVKDKRDDAGTLTMTDPGVEDKRLLVLETELASVLQQLNRTGNTLSAALREAWDDRDLRVLTRNSPLQATAPHISLVGHITMEELSKDLTSISAANGFANRFVWVLTRRSKLLPNPDRVPQEVLDRLAKDVAETVDCSRRLGEIIRSEAAAQLWSELYPELEEERVSGLAGKLVSRSSAHVLRLSLIYALLDCSPVIHPVHLQAAVALWRYSEASVEYMFGDRLGDPIADTILEALRKAGSLTRTDIINLGSRKWPADKIAHALQALIERRLAQSESESTGGRPAERWSLVAGVAG